MPATGFAWARPRKRETAACWASSCSIRPRCWTRSATPSATSGFSGEGEDIEIERTGPHVTLRFRETDKALRGLRHNSEYIAAILVRACRDMTRKRISPVRAEFMHGRPNAKVAYAEYLGCPVKFHAEWDALVYDAETMRLPVIGADSKLFKVLERACRKILGPTPKKQDILHDVRELVIDRLAKGTVQFDDVARELNMSSKTLERRLADRKTTFSALLDDNGAGSQALPDGYRLAPRADRLPDGLLGAGSACAGVQALDGHDAHAIPGKARLIDPRGSSPRVNRLSSRVNAGLGGRCDIGGTHHGHSTMNDSARRLRAQKAYSTDPAYLERMARQEEARAVEPANDATAEAGSAPARRAADARSEGPRDAVRAARRA